MINNAGGTSPVGGAAVRFLSWNVKGLNGPVKRTRIFSHLKQLKTDVLFLQETHLRLEDHTRLRKAWVNHIFHSKFNNRSRGVAILINKLIQFSLNAIMADPNGRYVIVSGLLFQTPVLLVNVYAPNWDDAEFSNKLLSSLPNLDTHRLILAGDLNCTIDPLLDKSSPKSTSPSVMSRVFSDFMRQNGCLDPWRFQNPTSKQFSFFSHVHHSFSRIDYFFIDSSFIPAVKSVEYLAIIISDHAPLILDLSFTLNVREQSFWRLNSLLLSNEKFCEHVSTNIDTFLEVNKKEGISYSLLWETLKAYLRGQIISYVAHVNRERRKQIEDLTDLVFKLDRKYSESPSPELYKERIALQSKLNLLSTNQAEYLLLRTRSTYYEYGEKASRLLAHQLKRQAASRLIPQVKDQDQNIVTNPKEINNTFATFYSTLYTSEFPSDVTNMNSFLDNLELPTIEPGDREELDRPLKQLEITAAIGDMRTGKSPGPDGYPPEFFKKFKDKLVPIMLEVFNESLGNGYLPPTLTQAKITLLLKKDKDPTSCGSYRPISLLNVDIKILAKVMAHRLESILPKVISEDRTGFIKGRHSFSNIRRLANVIYSPGPSSTAEAVISLDAEKAFGVEILVFHIGKVWVWGHVSGMDSSALFVPTSMYSN